MKYMSNSFQVGDDVKLILDKENGPDNHLHGKTGEIINIEFDDAQSVTGDSEDNFIYTIQLENGDIPDIHFRRHDLKKI
jgi:ribosomal protein L21E